MVPPGRARARGEPPSLLRHQRSRPLRRADGAPVHGVGQSEHMLARFFIFCEAKNKKQIFSLRSKEKIAKNKFFAKRSVAKNLFFVFFAPSAQKRFFNVKTQIFEENLRFYVEKRKFPRLFL